ncbi:hypothetical protein [Chlorogloeopsis sp. ULAP02]|uniref:hypothetical protein n=1 Tax=Chlorogloeopsis sp. ULAP02 TaxID=3107926 RepID=UPI0031346B83
MTHKDMPRFDPYSLWHCASHYDNSQLEISDLILLKRSLNLPQTTSVNLGFATTLAADNICNSILTI